MEKTVVCQKVDELHSFVREWKQVGEAIVLVPTMGALHEGHLSLIRRAKSLAPRVIVSIFVNPKQFNSPDDLLRYPRTLEQDLALLQELEVDLVFTPSEEVLYPDPFFTVVEVSRLTSRYEGEGRPGHFAGVTTVVTILFSVCSPDIAIFGEKDFQQLRVVEQLVRDLQLSIQIVRGPLIREEDGLALSSRNVRLSSSGREIALSLSRSLFCAREIYRSGVLEVRELIAGARAVLLQNSEIELHYLEVVDEVSLLPVSHLSDGESYRLLLAASVEGIRLIDNLALD